MRFSRTSLKKASPFFGFVALGLLMAAFSPHVRARESSSRRGDTSNRTNLPSVPAAKSADGTKVVPVAANSPAAALRGVLQAACSQDMAGFSRYLTARSKDS